MAETKKSRLKSLKDELEAQEDRLVADFLAEAENIHLLAPLKHEIALLEAELEPKKAEAKDS